MTDPRLVAAIVDRLTFRAHILQTGGESYQLRSSRKARTKSPPESANPLQGGVGGGEIEGARFELVADPDEIIVVFLMERVRQRLEELLIAMWAAHIFWRACVLAIEAHAVLQRERRPGRRLHRDLVLRGVAEVALVSG